MKTFINKLASIMCNARTNSTNFTIHTPAGRPDSEPTEALKMAHLLTKKRWPVKTSRRH